MTVGEMGEGAEVLPEFTTIAERYMRDFEFDAGSQRLITQMLARGSTEILRLPEGPERDKALMDASQRLDAAMQAASSELREARYTVVDMDTLTTIMQPLCPVPPFCTRMGPGGESSAQGVDAPSVAVERELVTQ